METDSLAELIRARCQCLLRLSELGRRQLELIEAGRMTLLLDLLAAKQEPLKQLQEIERSLEPFRGDGRQFLWPTPEARDRCGRQLEQSQALLAEIIRQEKHCEAALVRRRNEAAEQLREAHFAGQARGAYTEQAPAPATQLDLRTGN